MTPIAARVSTPFSTHSSVSPSPMMKLEETWFFPNTETAFSRARRIYSSESPGQTRAKIPGSIVSTLYLISHVPDSNNFSDEVSVGYTETPMGRSYRRASARTTLAMYATSFSGDSATPLVREIALTVPRAAAFSTMAMISSIVFTRPFRSGTGQNLQSKMHRSLTVI